MSNVYVAGRIQCSSIALVMLACASTCHAQLGQNLFLGNAKALSLGNAVTADPPGIDAIHFNPAGLARLQGQQVMLKFVTAKVDVLGEFNSTPEYDCFFSDKCMSETYGLPRIQYDDPARNSKSRISNVAVYLPGVGAQEISAIAAPLGGISYSPAGGSLTFATAMYAPMLLGYTREKNDPGRFYGTTFALSRITYLSPSVGWRYSDTLQFGAGIGLSYVGAGFSMDYRTSNILVGGAAMLLDNNDGTDNSNDLVKQVFQEGKFDPFDTLFVLSGNLHKNLSPTVNLGFLWEPTGWFTIGGVYQGEARDRLRGEYGVRINPNIINFIDNMPGALELLDLAENHGDIRAKGHYDLTTPKHISIGTSTQITQKWKLNIDWKWTETSVWKDMGFIADDSVMLLRVLHVANINGIQPNAIIVPRNYKDVSNFAFGLEYTASDAFALRLGYEPRKSGIPRDRLDFLIPLGDFDLYGAGLSYHPSATQTAEVSLGYFKSDQHIKSGQSRNGNDTTRFDNFVYNPSAGMDVRSILKGVLLEFSYQFRY
ncbi:Membrane protein involved in aromatic hydrocarbon degradation [gamma proteobacterium HdN1]|nr:Membrane protein involved in aromatic hydrocarbon degradation [gamma proteobacterium HdN1]